MKTKWLLLFVFSIGSYCVNAQNNPNSQVFVGFQTPILSQGYGFELGIRADIASKGAFGLTSQLSFNQYAITGSFLSGKKSNGNTSNLLIGPKISIFRNSKLKPSILCLGGLQSHYKQQESSGNSLGLGMAAMFEVNMAISSRFFFGAYAQSPGFLGLKCAYSIRPT